MNKGVKSKETTEREIRKEIARWFMDIAKYIATAILITSFLGEFEQKWLIYGIGLLLVMAFFFYGVRTLKKR